MVAVTLRVFVLSYVPVVFADGATGYRRFRNSLPGLAASEFVFMQVGLH